MQHPFNLIITMDCLSKFSLLKFEKEQDNIIKTNKKIINNKIIRNRPI